MLAPECGVVPDGEAADLAVPKSFLVSGWTLMVENDETVDDELEDLVVPKSFVASDHTLVVGIVQTVESGVVGCVPTPDILFLDSYPFRSALSISTN